MEEILQTRRQLHRMSSQLSQIRQFQSEPASHQRDDKLAITLHTEVGPGLEGAASDYARALEKNITEWTDPFEELVRMAFIPE